MTPLRVRLNARLDTLPGEADDSVVLLLVAADEAGAVLRSPRAFEPGEVLRLNGSTTCHDHHAFSLSVSRVEHRVAADEALDFYEVHGTVPEREAYHAFLRGLALAYRGLREDLRFLLPLPARVRVKGRWIATHADNVSYGGAFLVVNEPPWQVGEPLAFSLTFPSGTCLAAEGLVVYAITQEKARQLGGPTGVGIRLTLPDERREAWRTEVEALRAQVRDTLHLPQP